MEDTVRTCTFYNKTLNLQASTASASPWRFRFGIRRRPLTDEQREKLSQISTILREAYQKARANPSQFRSIIYEAFKEIRAIREECLNGGSSSSSEESSEEEVSAS